MFPFCPAAAPGCLIRRTGFAQTQSAAGNMPEGFFKYIPKDRDVRLAEGKGDKRIVVFGNGR